MWNRTVVTVVVGAALLSGCHAKAGPSADIAKIADLKSSFGNQFKVTEIPKTGIDPKFLAGQKLPEGLKFQAPNCAEFASGQLVPTGTEGNMAAVSAEGEGNRFIVIAVETNTPVPVVEPGKDCSKVTFASGMIRGMVEAVEVPKIDGATTIGVHRVVQTTVNGKPRTGEVFNYSAHFGDFQVIVSANPLVLPDKPTAGVNTQRARDLLIAGVNAIRK
jgi:hypothetical protein